MNSGGKVAPETACSLEEYLRQERERDLLRLSTAGSVDDGKSTLIGRLLYDSRAVYEDQIASVSNRTVNGVSGTMDLALITDGLRAEREQGITIDVAYRYFSTPKRKFIIADTPGHEPYTRNMATGASTANLAIVLVDARKGILPPIAPACLHRLFAGHLQSGGGREQDGPGELQRRRLQPYSRGFHGIRAGIGHSGHALRAAQRLAGRQRC